MRHLLLLAFILFVACSETVTLEEQKEKEKKEAIEEQKKDSVLYQDSLSFYWYTVEDTVIDSSTITRAVWISSLSWHTKNGLLFQDGTYKSKSVVTKLVDTIDVNTTVDSANVYTIKTITKWYLSDIKVDSINAIEELIINGKRTNGKNLK